MALLKSGYVSGLEHCISKVMNSLLYDQIGFTLFQSKFLDLIEDIIIQ